MVMEILSLGFSQSEKPNERLKWTAGKWILEIRVPLVSKKNMKTIEKMSTQVQNALKSLCMEY